MEKEYKIVHANLYRPDKSIFKSSGKDKAECSILKCNNSENCGLYARGECAFLAFLSWSKCPYGLFRKETGYTKRANAYYSWVTKREEEYKDVRGKLKGHTDMLAVIGDYVFLPYPHMDMNESIPFLAQGGAFRHGNNFFPKEHFTVENIIKICNFHPQAMFGGEITSYQKEVVPKFIKHLSEIIPELFADLCKEYEPAQEIADRYSYVGRKALLSTLMPDVGEFVDIHGGHWKWDGEYLTSYNSHASFLLIERINIEEMRIKPKPNCKVEITDNNQVTEFTKFTT